MPQTETAADSVDQLIRICYGARPPARVRRVLLRLRHDERALLNHIIRQTTFYFECDLESLISSNYEPDLIARRSLIFLAYGHIDNLLQPAIACLFRVNKGTISRGIEWSRNFEQKRLFGGRKRKAWAREKIGLLTQDVLQRKTHKTSSKNGGLSHGV